uniref:Immunoglobulin domain-containing protein n=1 Tax=Pan troglodytes TaxID=9598 RepID=A0A2I3RH65_PANTR
SFFPGFFLLQGAWPHEGVHRKPSLLAHPGPLVKSEETVILQCWSDVMFEHFLLHREGKFNDTLRLTGELHDGVSKANFSIGPMTEDLAGTYRCYGSLSAPSDPLDIVITGLYEKPLSAQPGPTVWAGESVTLSCSSQSSYDMYHLSREEGGRERRLPAGPKVNGTFQADFSLGPATHGGTYRCFGSFRDSPYEWSDPSDPLLVSVTENPSNSWPSPTEPSSKTGEYRTLLYLLLETWRSGTPSLTQHFPLSRTLMNKTLRRCHTEKSLALLRGPRHPQQIPNFQMLSPDPKLSPAHEHHSQALMGSSRETTALSQKQVASSHVPAAEI